MPCYNDVKHYAQLYYIHTFETIENDFAICFQSNYGDCVFIKSPFGLLKVNAGRWNWKSLDWEYSRWSCRDFFNSLTKEKAEEYINEYVKQEADELTKSIAKRTKKIESETKLKEKEQEQLEKFVRYSKEKELIK